MKNKELWQWVSEEGFLPPGDVWQSLETVLSQSAWRMCCRLVRRGQGCCVHSSARDGPTTKRYPAQRVSRAGAERPSAQGEASQAEGRAHAKGLRRETIG